jgi:beta-galactosidase
VKNLFGFTNLSDYNFKWQLYKNGERHQRRKLRCGARAKATNRYHSPIPLMKSEEGDEYFVNIPQQQKMQQVLSLPAILQRPGSLS